MPWHPDPDPATQPFSNRTRNLLERLGRVDDAEWMGTVSAAEFTAYNFSGAATLLDFGSIIEAHLVGTVEGVAVSRQEVINRIAALRRSYPIDRIPASDPRMGFKGESGSIADVLEGALAKSGTPPCTKV